MISYIKGKLEYISEKFIIVENNGIGYNINVSEKTMNALKAINGDVKVFTYMNIKEDEISLYGFIEKEEVDFFNMLISVSGIGPKSALSILDVLTVNEIINAIINNDIKTLCRGYGIGNKAAQRIALELKDKVKNYDMLLNDNQNSAENVVSDTKIKKEAVEALIILGFSKNEALKAISSIETNNKTVDEIIKSALKTLSTQI